MFKNVTRYWVSTLGVIVNEMSKKFEVSEGGGCPMAGVGQG